MGLPFRAEHVGSLLRPEKLLKARAGLEGDQYRKVSGSVAFEQIRDLEDEAIRDAVKLQESCGLQVVTDGEFRRRSWYQDFVLAMGGTSISFIDPARTISAAVPFQDDKGVDQLPGHLVQVNGRLVRVGGIFTGHFRFLKSVATRTPKICLPSPMMLHFWGGRAAIDAGIYPDLDAFWNDAIAAWQAEIAGLYALGCRYLQIDDVTFPLICDPRCQQALIKRGDDPEKLIETYAGVMNRLVHGIPDDVTVGMHMCRGNNRGKWMGSGGYELLSEVVFRNIDVDAFFMEYDSDRAGDFRPLRHVPRGKKVVLGLVTTKAAALESKDALRRRIDEAARHLPLDQLCLSPQCGFASNFMGNPLTADDQRRKLELVVETAREVWG